MKLQRFIFILLAVLWLQSLVAQTSQSCYSLMIQKGDNYFNEGKFMLAFEKYDLAMECIDAPSNVSVAQSKKKASRDSLENQRIQIIKALEAANRDRKIAEAAKEASDSSLQVAEDALKKADVMQSKVELAMFDKAVKERNRDWKGYLNYKFSDTTVRNKILDKIDTLILSSNSLSRLPAHITKCMELRSLDLLGNDIKDWKDCFSRLSKLTKLKSVRISTNNLSDIPEQYWNIISGIRVNTTNLNELFKVLIFQTQLTYIEISGDVMSQNIVPNLKGIGNLLKLKNLTLLNCHITEIPAEIGKLTKLTSLNLAGNQLQSLPPEIQLLNNLLEINIQDNKFQELPLIVCGLQQLRVLNISYNQIPNLPPQIGDLSDLTNLNISVNQLQTLPAELWKLNNLKILSLFNNKITSISSEIGNLKQLTRLSLSYNKLTVLPPKIASLSKLTVLFVSGNKLKVFPNEILKLKELTQLSLSECELKTLPLEIGKLTKLTELDISDNDSLNFVSVCNAFAKYPRDISLTSNYSNSNSDKDLILIKIPYLTFLPKEISKLSNISSLVLSDCMLKELPIEVGGLTKITVLNVANNQLTNLIPEVSNLKNLINLNISGNKLTDIPTEIGKLDNLLEIDISKNPLKHVPQELFYLNITPNNYFDIAKTLFENQVYNQAVTALQICVSMQDKNYDYWYNLSYYALQAKQYNQTIKAALKTIELNPNANSVYTNLALGYLLNNEWNKAEEIYTEWKNRQFSDVPMLGKDAFILDINDMQSKGINHLDFEKVMKMMK